MKKVIITRSTGIIEDSRTIKLATELTNLGYDVTVLGWDRKNDHDQEKYVEVGEKSFKIEFFKEPSLYGGGLKNLNKMRKFNKWLKQKIKALPANTIIHACDFDTALPIYKICKKNNCKFIYDIFDFYCESHNLPFPLNLIIKKKELKVINNANCTVICSEQRVEQIKGSRPQKLVIIHNTPSMNGLELENTDINEKLKICFIGALTPDRLLDEILDNIPNRTEYDFLFGGVGVFEEKAKELAKTSENIKFLGKLPYSEVLKVEMGCDILFATYNPEIKNHKYSAPNKFYEAGCLCKPVIVCNNTGIDVLVKEHNTGLTCNYTAEDFFNKVDELNKDRDLLKRLAENGNKAYKKHFSWDIMRKRIEEMYKEISKY